MGGRARRARLPPKLHSDRPPKGGRYIYGSKGPTRALVPHDEGRSPEE